MKKVFTKSKTWVIILAIVGICSSASITNAQVAANSPTAPKLFPRQYDAMNSYWQEFNFVGAITKDRRLTWQLDWQYRRQSNQYGYNSNTSNGNKYDGNPFLHPYQNVFRPWVHYWTKTRKLRISISPIGYWFTYGEANKGYGESGTSNNSIKASAGATGLKEYPEIRSCYQITTYDKIGRVSLSYRARLELRWVGNNAPSTTVNTESGWDFFNLGPMVNSTSKYRMRLFVRADIPLQGQTLEHKEFYVAAFNELWVGLGKGTSDFGMLDQNRAYAALGYKIGKETRIELGYLNQIVANVAPPISSTGVVGTKAMTWNNVIHFTVIFDDFNKFFRKKKEEEKTSKRRNDFENDASF
ncbi:MAG TPA: DUF2490 domain-containing protein [Cytophagaceae bacterium]|jgi:hypothetical protein|nr:DUF2490 domain-containing protein [Cytophagaceae bacterium]